MAEMSLLTETQLDYDGRIIVDSLPEPTRTLIRNLAEARTIDWIADGAEFALSIESYFVLAYWIGCDIETKH